MTSKIMSFLKMFGASRTATQPNSRAIVNVWRRFFELKEQEEEAQLESIVQALEENGFNAAANPAIQSETAVRARQDFLRDHYRKLTGRNNSVSFLQGPEVGSSNRRSGRPLNESSQAASPNLAVPSSNEVDADWMYLAQ